MALTLRNLRRAIQAEIGDSTPTYATQIDLSINVAGRDVTNSHDWPERMAQAVVLTVAPYTTGTVALTNGSKTVTGTGTTFTSGMVGRRFSLGYTSPFYEISAYVSATEITLSENYAEDTVSGEDYVVYQDRYSVASDCGKLGKLRVQNIGHENPQPLNYNRLDQVAYLPGSTGGPELWAFDGLDSNGYKRVIIRPVPDAVYRIHYRYLKSWTELTQDSSLPVLSEDRRNLILERALWRCYSLKRETADAAAHLTVYDKLLADAKGNESPVEEETERMAPFDSPSGDAPYITFNQPTDGY